jgi:3-dehydroquinate synthase
MKPYRLVRQSRAYPVYIGTGLLERVGELVGGGGKPFLLVPAALAECYGATAAGSFDQIDVITFDDGEGRKTLETANALITALLERGARRDSVAVVVGGGMAGDTAGFAASIFLRGIDVVHVPTTLLAQVDSSIGGKVAVNHPKGKNLIGSFHVPRAVISDVETLDTLPPAELLSGVFEALKGGIIADRVLFERIVEGHELLFADSGATRTELLTDIVRRAVDVKADIVSEDEREGDQRRLLNYGHTVAHGIETAMNYQGITHGEAVAWGMIAANAVAECRGVLPREACNRIDRAILDLRPRELPPLDRDVVLAAMGHDKKFTGTKRVMVLARDVGRCEIVEDVTAAELELAVDAVV